MRTSPTRPAATAPAPRSRRARAEASPASREMALTLLNKAVAGDIQAFQALRARLDLPGAHAGAAKCERSSLAWVDALEIEALMGCGSAVPARDGEQL